MPALGAVAQAVAQARAVALARGPVAEALRRLEVLGGPKASAEATIFLVAVALQESGGAARRQMGDGPARGFWQFEMGGVLGVMNHSASRALAAGACAQHCVQPITSHVHATIEGHDVLAAQIARLLLLTDPQPAPRSAEEGWACYLRLWRPGKPRPDTWGGCWETAEAVVRGLAGT